MAIPLKGRTRLILLVLVGLVWVANEAGFWPDQGTAIGTPHTPSASSSVYSGTHSDDSVTPPSPVSSPVADAGEVDRAFAARLSDQIVQGQGEVIKLLADDNKGSRHQRFLLRLASGRTLLVAHNIDLAPRINQLQKGDLVAFQGEYEWNPKGGVLHWTHHDPAGRHPGGWLELHGRRYQ